MGCGLMGCGLKDRDRLGGWGGSITHVFRPGRFGRKISGKIFGVNRAAMAP